MRLGLRLPRDWVSTYNTTWSKLPGQRKPPDTTVWTYERLLFPQTPVETCEEQPNVPWPEHSRQAADPLAVLTTAAVVTERVRLGVSVLVAALHIPVQLANALATIDQISGGRVIAGLGTGWSTDEFQATGATRADRGRFLDETLDVFDAVWGPDPVTFRSPRVIIDNAAALPTPVSKIPVMLGGGDSNLSRSTTSAAVQRIPKRADGWLLLLTTPGPAGAAGYVQAGTVYASWLLKTAATPARCRWLWSATSPSPTVRHDPDRSAFVGSPRPNHGRRPHGRRGRRRRAHRGSESAGLVHQHCTDARDGDRDTRRSVKSVLGQCL